MLVLAIAVPTVALAEPVNLPKGSTLDVQQVPGGFVVKANFPYAKVDKYGPGRKQYAAGEVVPLDATGRFTLILKDAGNDANRQFLYLPDDVQSGNLKITGAVVDVSSKDSQNLGACLKVKAGGQGQSE